MHRLSCTSDLLRLRQFVLRREHTLASDRICSRFYLTFDWSLSSWFVCGDTEELPELLKLFEATGRHQAFSISIETAFLKYK